MAEGVLKHVLDVYKETTEADGPGGYDAGKKVNGCKGRKAANWVTSQGPYYCLCE